MTISKRAITTRKPQRQDRTRLNISMANTRFRQISKRYSQQQVFTVASSGGRSILWACLSSITVSSSTIVVLSFFCCETFISRHSATVWLFVTPSQSYPSPSGLDIRFTEVWEYSRLPCHASSMSHRFCVGSEGGSNNVP